MNGSTTRKPWSRWTYAVGVLTVAAMIAAPTLVSAQSSAHGEDQMFTSVPICTIIDSRNWTASNFSGHTKPQAGTTYTFDIRGESQDFSAQGGSASGCGVPASADAVLINLLAVNPDGGGNMKAMPKGTDPSTVSGTVINYNALNPNVNLNNAVTVLMDASTDDGDIDIRPQINGTHIIGTVLGYFQNTTDGFYTQVESDGRFSVENAIAENAGSTGVANSSSDTLLGSVSVTVPDRCSSFLIETWDFEIHATGFLDGGASDSIIWLEDSDSVGNSTWVDDPDSGHWSFAVHDVFTEGGSGTKTFELHADNFSGGGVTIEWQLTGEAKDFNCTVFTLSEHDQESGSHPTDKRTP